jgi:hypothetical protein
MKTLAITIVAGSALCSAMAVPALAIPMSNLAAAASDLAPAQSVRYIRNHYRHRDSSRGYPGHTANCRYGLDQVPPAIRNVELVTRRMG